ncbi:MAG: hypothetical protein IT437_09935 [Phycisphaerales bacterium]|nr:hypothetical protein [Phycisphaerales bacterium]
MRDRARPVERFLGPDEARGGPFALLGVAPETCTEDAVLAGLDRQLERLRTHPECDTPEADEVRLALHAAAAQLLDPTVRRQLVASWTGTEAAQTPQPAASTPQRPHRRQLEHDAVLTLGLHGGWNERSLQHLAALAHARGMGSEQVAAALRTLAKRPGRTAGKTAPRPAAAAPVRRSTSRAAKHAVSSAPLPEQQDPAARLLWMLALFGGGGIVLAVFAIWVVVQLVIAEPSAGPVLPPPSASGPPAPVVQSQALSTTRNPRPTATDPKPAPAESERAPGPGELPRAIAASTAEIAKDAGAALAHFETGIDWLARAWVLLPPDELVAANDAVVEFVYRAGSADDAAVKAIMAVGRGAEALSGRRPLRSDGVSGAAWSLGMLARLWHEKNLPAAAKSQIDQRIAAATASARPVQDRTFQAGAGAALAIIPELILPRTPEPGTPPESPGPAWAQWVVTARAWAGADEQALARVVLDGLGTLLLHGPEPSDNRTYELILRLTQAVTWRDGDPARARLLRWFDDARVTNADLNAVTSTLATRSAAEGVDLTMVLSPSSSARVRGDLRERYARLWNLDIGVDRTALDSEWVRLSQDAVTRSNAARTGPEHLAATVILSRLNESAWRRWKGDAAESLRILGDLASDVDRIVPPGGRPEVYHPKPDQDAGWGEKYLAARRGVPQRLELLGRIPWGVGGLGPVDAEVLVQEALLGTPAEVRVRAAEVAKSYLDSPTVINAMLEDLPRAPRIPHTAQLVEAISLARLPSVTDPAWPAAARRALVERYLERVTAEGSLAPLDQLARLLAASYRGMASDAVLTPALRDEPVQPPAGESARQVWTRWRAEAEAAPPASAAGPTLADLDRRHDGRTGLARGLVQSFAAEQASVLDAMAAVVAAEQPARAAEVQRLTDNARAARASAETILEQINIVERAKVQLWVLRSPAGESS